MIVHFEPHHLFCLDVQDEQEPEMAQLHAAAPGLSEQGPCWTVIHGEQVICCMGMIHIHPHRASAWAMLSASIGPRGFLYLDRAMRRVCFKENPVRRLETTVAEGFEKGRRWVELLGFRHEGLMRGFMEDGAAHHLYARVTE